MAGLSQLTADKHPPPPPPYLVFDDLYVAVADEDGSGVQRLEDVCPRGLVPEGDVLETLTTTEPGLSPRYFYCVTINLRNEAAGVHTVFLPLLQGIVNLPLLGLLLLDALIFVSERSVLLFSPPDIGSILTRILEVITVI